MDVNFGPCELHVNSTMCELLSRSVYAKRTPQITAELKNKPETVANVL